MDYREAEIKWMVKGKVNYLGDGDATFDDYGYSRSFKFDHVLCALDSRAHFHIRYILLHLCDARQQAYNRRGVHGEFHINTPYFVAQLYQTFSNRP